MSPSEDGIYMSTVTIGTKLTQPVDDTSTEEKRHKSEDLLHQNKKSPTETQGATVETMKEKAQVAARQP